jgi:NAD-dependent dihydropyrimidine dehydrogenase PreA subunit
MQGMPCGLPCRGQVAGDTLWFKDEARPGVRDAYHPLREGFEMSLFKPEKKQIAKNAGVWDVVLNEDMCKACKYCISICPVDVFAWREGPNILGWFPVYVAHEENCFGCMLCYQICPDFCLEVAPKAVAAPAEAG